MGDRADALEAQNKETNARAEKADDEAHNLQKRLQTLENDLDQVSEALLKANTQLVEKDKALQNAEREVAALNRRIQLLEEDLERSEERLNTATTKLAEASQAADESERMRKVLENRSLLDEERMVHLRTSSRKPDFWLRKLTGNTMRLPVSWLWSRLILSVLKREQRLVRTKLLS